MSEKRIHEIPIHKEVTSTPSTPTTGYWKIYAKNGSWYILDDTGNETQLATGGSVAITSNYIPQGNGSSIIDGTWAFQGNDIYPLTSGSNIGLFGSPEHRIGTIFLSSELDYLDHLIFSEIGLERARFQNGNFGIGTNNPTETLHIDGTFRLVDGTESNGYVLTCDANGVASWQVLPSAGISGSGTNTYITRFTGATSVGDGTWAFSGNHIYPLTDGSNIGLTGTNRVGTIFLASTLDYASNLVFSESGVERGRFNGANFGIAVTPSVTFQVGTTLYANNSSTQVGIGRTPTTYTLEVENSPLFTRAGAVGTQLENRTVSKFTTFNDGTFWGVFVHSGGSYSSPGSDLYHFEISNTGRAAFGANSGNITDSTSRVRIVGIDSISSTFALKVENSSGSPSLYVRDDRYVGFGTSSPTAPIDLTGWYGINSTQIQLHSAGYYIGMAGTKVTFGHPQPTAILWEFNNGAAGMNITSASAGRMNLRVGDGAVTSGVSIMSIGWTTAASGGRAFEILDSSSTVKFQVLQDGKVGINTSSPTSLFHLDNNGVTAGNTTFRVEGSFFGDFNINTYGGVGIGATAPSNTALLIGATGNAAMRVEQSGNIWYELKANGDNDAYIFLYGDD